MNSFYGYIYSFLTWNIDFSNIIKSQINIESCVTEFILAILTNNFDLNMNDNVNEVNL